MRLRRVRKLGKGRAIGGNCLVDLAPVLEDVPVVDRQVAAVGRQRQRLFHHPLRVGGAALSLQHPGEIVVRLHRQRVGFDGGAQMCFRLVVAQLHRQRLAEPDHRLHIARRVGQCFAVGRFGVVEPFQCVECQTEIEMRVYESRLQRNGFRIMRRRLVQPVQLAIGIGEIEMAIGEIGVIPKRLLIYIGGAVDVAGRAQRTAQDVVDGRFPGSRLDRLLQQRDRIARPPIVEQY